MGREDENIEKIFYQDIRSKRLAGSGAFHMTGKGKKSGLKGGILLGASKFKKPYEKNSRVTVRRMYDEVMHFDQFAQESDNRQEELLLNWLVRYSKDKIRKDMGISYNKIEKLIEKYVTDEKLQRKEMEIIMNYKEEIIPYQIFSKLPKDQAKFLLDYYSDKYEASELAESWGIKISTLYNKRYELRDVEPSEPVDIENVRKGYDRIIQKEAKLNRKGLEKPNPSVYNMLKDVEKIENIDNKKQKDSTKVIKEPEVEKEKVVLDREEVALEDGHKKDKEMVKKIDSEDIKHEDIKHENIKHYDDKDIKSAFSIHVDAELHGTDLKKQLEGIVNILRLNSTYNIKLEMTEVKRDEQSRSDVINKLYDLLEKNFK